jgi:hypothetical protein
VVLFGRRLLALSRLTGEPVLHEDLAAMGVVRGPTDRTRNRTSERTSE